MAITPAASASPWELHQIPIQCWEIVAIKKLAKSSAPPAWHLPTWKTAENSDKKASPTQQLVSNLPSGVTISAQSTAERPPAQA